MLSPQLSPAGFTIPALIGIILTKEGLYRLTSKGAENHESTALLAEAWHHRTDAFTSLGVLLGILIAVIAGPKYAWVDDLAACLVTILILYNAYRIIRPAVDELMDRRIDTEVHGNVLGIVQTVDGVREVETLIVRRSGREHIVDVHIEVDPDISVADGHDIAHAVKDQLLLLPSPKVVHVTTHVEPFEGKPG